MVRQRRGWSTRRRLGIYPLQQGEDFSIDRHGRTFAPERLAGLILAILRGIEALGKAGKSKSALRGIADAALALLPRA